jgi:membrane protein involved in colicin uptake
MQAGIAIKNDGSKHQLRSCGRTSIDFASIDFASIDFAALRSGRTDARDEQTSNIIRRINSDVYTRGRVVSEENESIHARLSSLENEVTNLREGYLIISRRYNEALKSLKDLTTNAAEAALRAAASAEKSAYASKKAAEAAKEAVAGSVMTAANEAAEAAEAAAMAAIEAAASAAAAAAAAAAAVSHQAEEMSIQASAEAAQATNRAALAAAKAVKMANLASSYIKEANKSA